MASCYINPFPQEISQDEFLLILNANNLYEQYLNHINNNDDLSDFFNQNQTIINSGIDDVKGLRDFKSGKINNFESINDNKIISYYINNNVDNNVLKIIDKGFTEVYYKVISQSNAPFSELININDLVTMPYKKGVETNNVLIRFFGNLIALKLRTQEELLTNKKISGETLTENDKLFNEKLVNYINSLGIYENPNKPLISLYNLKNNTRLKELIKFLGRDGLFRLDDKVINNINDEIEILENNVQIYDKDPLTEDPSDKISGRLKLMLRGISKYDLNGNPIKVQNIPQYWKPSELIFELLKEISDKNVHNYSLNQILDKLKILSKTTNNRLSKPAQKFLSRLEILHDNIKTFENSNLDIYTDLFLYFQQSLVGIAILEERFETISTIDRGGNLEYISVSDYKLINKTNFDNYGFTKVIEDFVLNLKTNELLKNNFNTSEELVLKPNQSINSLAEVLNNILSPSLLVNKEEFKVRLINKLKNNITDQKGISDLKEFLKTIIKNNEVLNSDFISKVYNVNNDTLFPVISPSELSEEISLINSSIRAIKQGVAYEDTDFFKKFGTDIVGQSLWGDYVKNAGDTLKVSIFTAYKNTETSNEFSNFTRKELLASFFNINNTLNTIHTPILSDKSNIYLIENYNFSNNVISPEEDFFSGMDALSDVSNSINFFDYIISFLKIDNDLNEKINNQNISIGKNIDNAFKIQPLFLFNPEYYGIETNENVLNLYNTYVSTSSSISEKNQAKISLIEIITEVYNKIGDNLFNEFVGNNLITFNDDKYIINPNSLISNFNYPQSIDGSDKLVDDIKKAAIKSYIFTTHLSLLTNGHLAFFKINDEQKRTKAIVADSKKVNLSAVYKGETILIDNINRRIILKDVQTTVKNADLIEASLQQLKSEGLKGDELLEKMANLYSNSVLLDSTEVFTLESEKLTDIQNKFLEETKNLQEELNTIEDPTSKKYKELTDEINEFKEKYSKLEKEVKFVKSKLANTTDASSVMSLDFSRKYHVGLNMYSDEQEELYEAEKKGSFLKKFTKDNFKIIKNIVYTKLKRNGIMTSYMEKTSTDNFTAQRVFIGNEPNIYQAMLGKMFGYTFDEKNESWSYNPNNAVVEKVVYESAVKAEVPTKETGETIILDLEKFIKDNKIENLEDVNNFKFNEVFSNEYVIDVTTTEDRLQVETPEHLEAQGDLGTQIDALIHNAINIEDNYKIGNKVYNGNELTVLLNDLKKSFIDIGVKNLYNKYNNNTLNTIYELISELYEDRDYLNIETLTLEKIPELLKNPQFGLALVSKIQSQIKRNVVKTRMNTFQLFNGVIGYSDDLKILVETDTDKDGNEFKKIIFEVAMPAISEDIFNTTLNSETGKLDINLLPKEIKDMVVYRIPTEAIYSMFVIRIKKLLHPSAGPIIYMPIGTTPIAGFDMDIDKLFGILKNYKLDKDNKIKVISYSLDKDSNVNFKEWIKENISLEDKASLTTFFEEKTKLIEKNKDILNTNEELKSLLERKKELVEEIKDNLVTNFNLSGSNLSKNISIQVNENKEYIRLKEAIETIINSKELKDLDVLMRDFQEIDANIQAIQKPYKDEWKQLNVTQQMSSLQLQNLNFDILTNTISNFKNINTYLTGNNFVRLEEINDINEAKKIKSNPEYAKQVALNKRLPYKDRSLLNNVNTFMAIMSGSQNIGPTAIMNQFLGYLKFLQNFNQDKEFGFNFNSNVTIKSNSQKDSPYFNLFLGLNNMKTKSGQTAALANAVLLAQAVDNIKKDLSVPLNLHKNLMGLRGLLYMVGLDENVVDRLFTDVKLVDKIIKDSIANGDINKYKKNIFKVKSILDKTGNNNLVLDSTNENTGEVSYSINLEDLNKSYNPEKNVLDLFTNNINEEDIVKFLSVMFDFSSQLTDLILITNNFYTGFGKNFKELANNFLDTQEFLSKNDNLIYTGDLANNLLINTKDSFIEYKLKTLLDVTNNIYKLFNIDLNNLNYKNLIDFVKRKSIFLSSPSNKGYLFQANLSVNLYLNLINELGSAETLSTTYYQEVQDLKNIFSVSKLVEDSGNNEYTISPNQNLNLSILKNIIRFVNTTPYFLQTNQEISDFRSLYPFDIQFLGQTEQINTFDTPKKIIDLFSNDTQTKYATNLEGPITEDKVISAKDIAKKLFFVNMVQSALFSGKTNRGRSNMFEMLFLDNIFLQNSILHINKNYSSLINDEIVNLDYNFFQNTENANALIAFLTINNFETFSNPNVVYNLENIRFKESKKFIHNSLFGQPTTFSLGQRGNLTNVISLNKNQIPITQNETFQRANRNSINKVLNKQFLIVTPEKETYSILFQKVYVQEDTYYYKKLGIINVGKLYSSRENNIAFSLLQPLLINNGIEADKIIVEPIVTPVTPTELVKEGVLELFESNPELANAVYETLGFEKININEYVNKKIEVYNAPSDLLKKAGIPLDPRDYNGDIYLRYSNGRFTFNRKEKIGGEEFLLEGEELSLNEIKKIIKYSEGYISKINPQQKQQALQKFQEYVNATGKQDIEGFKEFVTQSITTQSSTSVDTKWYDKFREYVNRGYYQQFIKDLQKTKTAAEIDSINAEIRNVYIQELQQKYPQLGNISIASDGSTVNVDNINILKQLEPTLTRLMVGNHGVYLEFTSPVDTGTFVKKRMQYNEYIKNGIKLYDQFQTVNYADYKVGKWYADINDYKLTTQSSTNIKEGVTELFESNSELSSIGTQQQYSNYLDSIFPDSQVKDIVYHSRFNVSNIKNKDRWKNGFYSGTKDQADLMADMAENSNDLMTTSALLINMQNPKVTTYTDRKVEDYKNTNDGFIIEATEKDVLQLIGDRDGYNTENFKKEYVVFEPEQIHILGSKQDIEGFKEFVTQSITTQPSSSVVEFDVADKLTPIEQNFTDGTGGRKMQPQFKGKSTMDLIISGDRTRTTRANTDIQRMAKDYGLSKISDLVGRVIRMTDKTGRQVYTRITKVVPFTQEYQDATWQKEGWVKSVTDKNVGNYPYAIEFEVVNKPTQPSIQPTEDEDFGSIPPCVN